MQGSCCSIWLGGRQAGEMLQRLLQPAKCSQSLYSPSQGRGRPRAEHQVVIGSPALWSESTIPCRRPPMQPFPGKQCCEEVQKAPQLLGWARISSLLLSIRPHLHTQILSNTIQNQQLLSAVLQQLSTAQMHLLVLKRIPFPSKECKNMPRFATSFLATGLPCWEVALASSGAVI